MSAQAALRGNADISIGNIVGSNIANIGLILGLAALVYPMTVKLQFLQREIPIMIGVLVLFVFISQDFAIVRAEGVLLLAGAVAFTILSYVFAKREGAELTAEIEEFEAVEGYRGGKLLSDLGLIAIGIITLMVASDRLVFSSVNIARSVGVSELAIGITLVAVGTSLPELATSLIAAFKKESEIAIGNVVGSNIFNYLQCAWHFRRHQRDYTSERQSAACPDRYVHHDRLCDYPAGLLLGAQTGTLGRRNHSGSLCGLRRLLVLCFTACAAIGDANAIEDYSG